MDRYSSLLVVVFLCQVFQQVVVGSFSVDGFTSMTDVCGASTVQHFLLISGIRAHIIVGLIAPHLFC